MRMLVLLVVGMLLVIIISALRVQTLVVWVGLGLDVDVGGLFRHRARRRTRPRGCLEHGRVLERLSIVRPVTVVLLALGIAVVWVWDGVTLLRCLGACWLWLGIALQRHVGLRWLRVRGWDASASGRLLLGPWKAFNVFVAKDISVPETGLLSVIVVESLDGFITW
jgi:hypothetical protein